MALTVIEIKIKRSLSSIPLRIILHRDYTREQTKLESHITSFPRNEDYLKNSKLYLQIQIVKMDEYLYPIIADNIRNNKLPVNTSGNLKGFALIH